VGNLRKGRIYGPLAVDGSPLRGHLSPGLETGPRLPEYPYERMRQATLRTANQAWRTLDLDGIADGSKKNMVPCSPASP